MCQATPPTAVSRIRSIESAWACCSNDSSNCGSHRLVGPATRALEEERLPKRRRVVSISTDEENNNDNEARDNTNHTDLFASLVDSNGEDAFPTIAWVFDDEQDDVA